MEREEVVLVTVAETEGETERAEGETERAETGLVEPGEGTAVA
jgi:hypothetical protein